MNLNRKVKKPFALPTGPISREKPFSSQNLFVHGFEHIGKTSLASKFEDPYFLSFDTLHPDLEYKASYITRWEDFTLAVDTLLSTPGYCKYVVIDNVSICHAMCSAYICKIKGIKYVGDLDHGKGWDLVSKEYEKYLFKLLYSEYSLIGLGHTKYKEVTMPDGSKIDRVTADGPDRCLFFWRRQLDIEACFCYDNIDKSKKILRIRGDYGISVNCRHESHFFYKDSTSPIMSIPMGSNPEEAFENFKLAYNNELPKPKSLIKRKP